MGSFRGNGTLDIAVADFGSGAVSILLGNGDGTFQTPVSYLTASFPEQVVVGDFNGDGHLDLAVATNNAVSILLGNGDGTFQPHVDYSPTASSIVAGDFNGDGKLDLAVGGGYSSVAVLLGNGDGTFQSPVTYSIGPTGEADYVYSVAVSDFNQDGKLDLACNVNEGGAIFLGNGDGTFQPATQYLLANVASNSIAVNDFNGDGAPDLAADEQDDNIGVMLSAAFKGISPGSLNFGSQGAGTTSSAQTITIRNSTNVGINIASIVAGGSFAQTNNCGASLGLGASCAVNVTFSPTATGPQSGSITITDNTRVSPLTIPLSGGGVSGSFLTTYPARLNFSPQTVGTSGNPTVIMLVNTGNSALTITGVSITGANTADFSQTNNCGSALPAAGSCAVNVTFTPQAAGSRTASVSVADSAPGSPQSASLVGTGLGPLPNVNPTSLAFASQVVGTSSSAQAVNLSNIGSVVLNIASIAASGDFSETNNCGTSLTVAGSCLISVGFSPTAAGNLTGAVTISDSAPGGPQTIPLSGVATAAPSFSVGSASGSPTSQTVSAGQTASFTLVLAPTGAFTGTVNLSCAITPAESPAPTCGLSSSSVQITGGGSQQVTVTVATTAPVTTSAASYIEFPPGAMPVVWTFMLLGSGCSLLRNRKRLPALAGPIILLALASWVGCSSGGGSSSTHTAPGTPAGTYAATVTASSGGESHSMALQVVVQ